MKTETLKGRVITAEVRDAVNYDPYRGRYSPNTSYSDFKALIGVELEDGSECWFYSATVVAAVTGCPVGAVVVCRSNDWLDGEPMGCFVEAGKPQCGATQPVLKVRIGDEIEFTGRFKAQTRFGARYTHVKRIQAKVVAQ